ncbi:hypothetical protein FQA47_013643 [Oryzias melastigma]|uniref:Uncharacterized protein n=1 Tax=Oryzias melastigma TaxID=30732 RepID=A0A834C1Z1_ORYME|nr:hypothetical protein FQA47_013643 [Oryzias melastigma]
MEHFKTTHGLVVSVQPPKDTPLQPGSAPSRSPSLSPASMTPTGKTKGTPRVHRDSINGQVRSGTTSPVSPMLNGSPSGGGRSPSAGSPLPVSPLRAPSLTISPVPEASGRGWCPPTFLRRPPHLQPPIPPRNKNLSDLTNPERQLAFLSALQHQVQQPVHVYRSQEILLLLPQRRARQMSHKGPAPQLVFFLPFSSKEQSQFSCSAFHSTLCQPHHESDCYSPGRTCR